MGGNEIHQNATYSNNNDPPPLSLSPLSNIFRAFFSGISLDPARHRASCQRVDEASEGTDETKGGEGSGDGKETKWKKERKKDLEGQTRAFSNETSERPSLSCLRGGRKGARERGGRAVNSFHAACNYRRRHLNVFYLTGERANVRKLWAFSFDALSLASPLSPFPLRPPSSYWEYSLITRPPFAGRSELHATIPGVEREKNTVFQVRRAGKEAASEFPFDQRDRPLPSNSLPRVFLAFSQSRVVPPPKNARLCRHPCFQLAFALKVDDDDDDTRPRSRDSLFRFSYRLSTYK